MTARIYLSLLVLPALLLALATPAVATDARQAIRLCEANPNCKFNVDNDGGVTLVADDKIVSCPRKGNCTCANCGPARTSGASGVKGGIGGVLAGSSNAAPGDKPAGTRPLAPKPATTAGNAPATSAGGTVQPIKGVTKPIKTTTAGKPPVYGVPKSIPKSSVRASVKPQASSPKPMASREQQGRSTSGQNNRR